MLWKHWECFCPKSLRKSYHAREWNQQNCVWCVVQVLPTLMASWCVCWEHVPFIDDRRSSSHKPWWLTQCFGMWFLMATVVGFSCQKFFSSHEYHETESSCPYHLSKFMTLKRLELVLEHLCLSAPNPPSYYNTFWEVTDMLIAWKKNMSIFFGLSWITCLDESMSTWNSRWTCPGWVLYSCKPHPFGNEYHTICCHCCNEQASYSTLNWPKERTIHKSLDLLSLTAGKTGRLLLCLTQSLHNSACYVVLDSSFCVLSSLIILWKMGVFAGALIKKCSWHVPGKAIVLEPSDLTLV